MTEITFVGDVHSNFSQFVRLTKKKKKTQCFFIVGDSGFYATRQQAQKDPDWKQYQPNMEKFISLYEADKIQKFKVPVYILKGIHNDFNIDTKYLEHKNIFFIKKGTVITLDSGIKIACLGGMESKIRTPRPYSSLTGKNKRFFTKEEINSIKLHNEVDKIDILVTYQAALGCVPVRHNVKQEEGSRELRKLLDDIHPRYYFHGHHHHNYAKHEDTYPIIVGLGNFGKNKKSFYTLNI